MAEEYKGFSLNQTGDKNWGGRENDFHKQLIDKIIDEPIVPLNNTKYVAVNGNDLTADGSIAKPFATIKNALASIIDNSVNNTYAIKISAGIFTEDSTLNVGEGISISGTGDSTVIKTSENNSIMFNLRNQSDLYNVSIHGPSNNSTISITESNSIVSLRGLKISNSPNSIYINANNSNINLYQIALRGNSVSFDSAITILDGNVNAYVLNTIDVSGNNLIYLSGASAFLGGWTVSCNSNSVTNLISVNNGAKLNLTNSRSNVNGTGIYLNNASVELNAVHFDNPTIGIDMGPDGESDLFISNVHIINSSSLDMRIQNTNSCLTGLNNLLKDSKIEFTNGIPELEYSLVHLSMDEGDVAINNKAELSVGSPDRPAESSLGEGDSYTRGMLAYQYDPTNGFVDITTEAKSFSGSNFSFSDVVTDSALYVSTNLMLNSEYVKFFGVKVQIATSGVSGTGNTTAEYWNGSAWTEFGVMRTQGESPYLPVIGNLIDSAPGPYQMRSCAKLNDLWEKNDPISSGTDRYWARIRITSDIITSPIFEQIKIHSNRTEINSDGWLEYFGKARPIGRFPWNYGMVQAAVSSPGDQDQLLSDTLDVGKIENAFANNVSDRVGFLAPVPFDLDTSTPIKFRWAARYSDNTGDVIWNIRSGYSTSNDIVYISQAGAPTTHPTQILTTITETVPSTIGQIMWHMVEIPVYNMNPRNIDGISDMLWVTIERDGTTDTFNGIAGLIAVAGDYLKWTEGGHQ